MHLSPLKKGVITIWSHLLWVSYQISKNKIHLENLGSFGVCYAKESLKKKWSLNLRKIIETTLKLGVWVDQALQSTFFNIVLLILIKVYDVNKTCSQFPLYS